MQIIIAIYTLVIHSIKKRIINWFLMYYLMNKNDKKHLFLHHLAQQKAFLRKKTLMFTIKQLIYINFAKITSIE